MARPSFTDLPTEILEAIFINLDPHSLVSASQTSRLVREHTADSPIVWRHLCQTHFKTWDARHNITAKFAGPLSDVDWRALFIEKSRIVDRTRQLLDRIVGTQHQRIRCVDEIANFGYDAKETLLEENECPDDAEDVLARRYYANAVLERIHREVAINVWKELQEDGSMPIEKALGAYDVFARVGEDVDMAVIERAIDKLAEGVWKEFPDFRDLSPRIKASTLASYIRDRGFKGVPDTSYRAISNSFIGLVLSSATHHSLPLISVAIFCALARRVGLDARPCGFLHHVYTLVYAPPKHTLDGIYKPTNSSAIDYMYLDPFRSSEEIGQGDLRRNLREMGIANNEHGYFLSDTSTREMVLRTARNIMHSVQTIRQTANTGQDFSAAWMHSYPDMDNAFYATIWSMLILAPAHDSPASSGSAIAASRRRQYLPYLLEHFQTHFPWDVTLLQQYVIPMFDDQPEGPRLRQFVASMHKMDATRKPVLGRDDASANVKFKIGQLFEHKRYGYEGVVTGWDVACDAGEEWIQNTGVDTLPSGRDQAFYHVL
jgi:F-box protein 21